MLRKAVLAIYDVVAPLVAALIVLAVATPQAHAYVDPSVMTYTIQAVAGVAVALSAVLGVALRRTRRALFKVLKIDENANKVVEPAVKAVDAGSPEVQAQLEAADAAAAEDKTRLQRGPQARRLSWPRRFIRALFGCGFAILTVFIASPLEIVAGSTDSLNFDFGDALPIVLMFGLIAIVVCSLVLSLFRGRAFDVLLTVVVALGVAAYVQALLMNESLPVADGSPLELQEHLGVTIVSTLVWLAIIVGLLILNAKKKTVCRPVIMAVSVLLIVTQTASLVSIGFEQQANQGDSAEKRVMTSRDLFQISEDENVVVFVLDFFETELLSEKILDKYPDTLDEFTGFTFYENSVGSMIPTRYGVPFLLTGEWPQDDETYREWLGNRFERSTFIPEIADAGYAIDIYSDTFYTKIFDDYVENIINVDFKEMDAVGLMKGLARMALYRDSPWLLKPRFWFSTEQISRNAISGTLEPYAMDDAYFGNKVREDGLTFDDNDKTFRFIHLMGAHFPYILDENGNEAPDNTDIETQARGALSIVSDYLKEMKRLGVYDNATIIVTSDHGNFYGTDEDLEQAYSPILLAKPAQSAEEAAEPLRISQAPTGHLDFQGTVLEAMTGDPGKYGTTIFDIEEGPRTRYYWTTLSDGHRDIGIVEYEINGDVYDFSTWSKTGRAKDIPDE